MRVMGCNLALISRSEPEFTYVASSGATFTREAEKTSLRHYPNAAKASFVRDLPLRLSSRPLIGRASCERLTGE